MSTYGSTDTSDIKNKDDKSSLFPNIQSKDVEYVKNLPQQDNKRPMEISTSSFLLTAMIGVPVYLSVVLPLTIAYQTGKAVLGSPPPQQESIKESMDTIPFPSKEDLIPMKERKYDVVLLGCTGFTGKLAAIYLTKTYPNLKWAIAGRSADKLTLLKQELQEMNSSITVDTIVVDTLKRDTIHPMVQNTRAIITTAGPFCKYGSNVVEFCARYGTNYVDITGETGWNKEMIMKFDSIAQDTGAKIISLCGHDSIPWDLSYWKLSKMLKEDCQDSISAVRFYDEIKGGVSGGTIDTMLTFVEGKYVEPRFDFDPYLRKADGSKSSNKTKNISSQLPSRMDVSDVDPNTKERKWTNPFVMASVNAEVVKRTHAMNENVQEGQKLTYNESNVQKSFKEAFVTWFSVVFGATGLLNPITGTVLKKVLPKPGQGPSPKEMKHGYLLLNGVGEGVKGSRVESALYFPLDAGYKETARMVCEAGLCLSFDSDKLPVSSGGFYSPATAMGDVLLDRLCRTGSKYASRVVKIQDGKLHSKL